jgi:hypothetical protein
VLGKTLRQLSSESELNLIPSSTGEWREGSQVWCHQNRVVYIVVAISDVLLAVDKAEVISIEKRTVDGERKDQSRKVWVIQTPSFG